jgi:uncharacterized protein
VTSTHSQGRIAVGAERTVNVACDVADPLAPVFVLAHGAGGHMADRSMLAVSELLRTRGVNVVRFNFPYRERAGGRPDPMPLLMACTSAVATRTRERFPKSRLIIGGRSMGGRVASMLAAEGFPCDGVLLLAYPLHPAGKPEKLRDAHLMQITPPVLCINGTRDSLCRRDLMEHVLARLGPNWRMHWLDGADHGFHVTKASGTTDASVLQEIGDVVAGWVRSART